MLLSLFVTSMSSAAQSSISVNSEYSIGELSTSSEIEECFNLSLDYNLLLKDWLSWTGGIYAQSDKFYSGGTYSSSGDVFVDGILLENVVRNMRAQGSSKALLLTSGMKVEKYGFSAGVKGGIGLSNLFSTWTYSVVHEGLDINRHSFKEEYEVVPTWLIALKLSYMYPVANNFKLGISFSGNILGSLERSITNTEGDYSPEEYYDPELSRIPATNYSENFIFSGLIAEFTF